MKKLPRTSRVAITKFEKENYTSSLFSQINQTMFIFVHQFLIDAYVNIGFYRMFLARRGQSYNADVLLTERRPLLQLSFFATANERITITMICDLYFPFFASANYFLTGKPTNGGRRRGRWRMELIFDRYQLLTWIIYVRRVFLRFIVLW